MALKRLHLSAELLQRFSLLLERRIRGIMASLLFFDDPEQALQIACLLRGCLGVVCSGNRRRQHA